MKIKNRIAVVVLLLLVWVALFAFSVKRTGVLNVIRNAVKPLLNYVYTPETLVLCDFESSEDFWVWMPDNSSIERSSQHVSSGEYTAKVTFYGPGNGSDISSIKLVGYNIGPKGEKDWSRFRYFKFNVHNPEMTSLPLRLKCKDKAGRSVYKDFEIRSGDNEVVVNLEDIGDTIDLGDVIYINLFIATQKEDRVIYLDAMRLEREMMKERNLLRDPRVEFIKLTASSETKAGGSFVMSCQLSATSALRRDYRIFIHVSAKNELGKKPSDRRWFINADREPWVPTSKWVEGQVYEVGPMEVFIPDNFPSGTYVIQAGLFNPDQDAKGEYNAFSSHDGTFDFRTSFPRLRYRNPGMQDYIVGSIEVTAK